MVKLIKENKVFYLSFLLLLTLAIIPICFYSKEELFILLNKYNSPILDISFSFLTHLGNGIVFVAFAVALIFFKDTKFHILVTLSSCILLSLIIRFMKRVLFADFFRPSKLLSNNNLVHWVEGIDLHTNYSFPSGHGATVFLLITLIAIFSKGVYKLYSIPLIIIAVIVAYSRMYLGQHFYEDIYVGSVIGVLTGSLTYLLIANFKIFR